MSKIGKVTRGESYKEIRKTLGERQRQCLVGLQELGGKASANDLARHLLNKGIIPFYNTNYTNPRLIELVDMGKVEVIDKTKDSFSGKYVAVYALKGDK